jgi:polysaccharide export outer membrane protein
MKNSLLLILFCGLAAAQTHPATASADTGFANLPAYKIGADDLIAVGVYDAPEFTRTVRIGADGMLRMPMLKRHIKALGLLPADLETVIAEALKAEQLIVEPVVTVTVVEYHSRPISVMGAVKSPTTFQAVGGVSLLDALTRAGGLGPEAGAEILVSRRQAGDDGAGTMLVQRVPVKGLIDAADPELNLPLSGGEEIRVPEVGRVFVVGNVKKPGAFPIQDGPETSVLKVLALAEGLEPFASKQAYIYRRDDSSSAKHEIPIPLGKIMARQSPDVPLLSNDILYVPDNTGRRAGMGALDRILGFTANTASGILVWRR